MVNEIKNSLNGSGLKVAIAVARFNEIVTDKLLAMTGGLAPALLAQTLLSGVLGTVSFAGVSLYDVEHWPLLRIAVVHYLIIEAAYMPIAFALGWLVSAREALIWMAFSAVAYLIIFLIMWAIHRAQIRELNRMQQQYQQEQRKEISNQNDTGGTT